MSAPIGLPNVVNEGLERGHALATPPLGATPDFRAVSTVLFNPSFNFYDPNKVCQPNTMLPTVPGGPVSMGLCLPIYDGQPMWNRTAPIAGPVRDFIRRLTRNNRARRV